MNISIYSDLRKINIYEINVYGINVYIGIENTLLKIGMFLIKFSPNYSPMQNQNNDSFSRI
jgi:hypothetical protein